MHPKDPYIARLRSDLKGYPRRRRADILDAGRTALANIPLAELSDHGTPEDWSRAYRAARDLPLRASPWPRRIYSAVAVLVLIGLAAWLALDPRGPTVEVVAAKGRDGGAILPSPPFEPIRIDGTRLGKLDVELNVTNDSLVPMAITRVDFARSGGPEFESMVECNAGQRCAEVQSVDIGRRASRRFVVRFSIPPGTCDASVLHLMSRVTVSSTQLRRERETEAELQPGLTLDCRPQAPAPPA